jgi:hypothetical protein
MKKHTYIHTGESLLSLWAGEGGACEKVAVRRDSTPVSNLSYFFAECLIAQVIPVSLSASEFLDEFRLHLI